MTSAAEPRPPVELVAAPVREWPAADRATFEAEIVPAGRPAVLRGLVRDWPAVAAGAESEEALARYVMRFDSGAPHEAFVGPPELGGRFFYGPELEGFNFDRQRARLGDVLGYLLRHQEGESRPAVYIGAASIPESLPGFERENPLGLIEGKAAVPRIWVGTATTVAPHFDLSDNIACVVAGRRRFVLFPPDQVPNLYVGPLDNTMAGQPASMVDVDAPDLDRYPRFREALAHAQVAVLEPGDAIYIPSPWWHEVRALTPFNILVNHWWDDMPADAGSPFEALAHGIFAVSHLPDARREAWRSLFDHYVFRRNGDPAAHLPPARRGILGASTPQLRAMMRDFLVRALSRR